MSSSEKIKITANLNSELVKAIDQFLKVKNQSRSQFIEDVLRKWHNEQKSENLKVRLRNIIFLCLVGSEKRIGSGQK